MCTGDSPTVDIPVEISDVAPGGPGRSAPLRRQEETGCDEPQAAEQPHVGGLAVVPGHQPEVVEDHDDHPGEPARKDQPAEPLRARLRLLARRRLVSAAFRLGLGHVTRVPGSGGPAIVARDATVSRLAGPPRSPPRTRLARRETGQPVLL